MTSTQDPAHSDTSRSGALAGDSVALLDDHLHASDAAAQDSRSSAATQLSAAAPAQEAATGDAGGDEVNDLTEAAAAFSKHARADDTRFLALATRFHQLQALSADAAEFAWIEHLEHIGRAIDILCSLPIVPLFTETTCNGRKIL